MNKKNIFEKIIDNEISSMKVYEDNDYIAILDIKPKQMGHTLLIPKKKKENILKENNKVKENILKIANIISKLLINNLNANSIKYIFNNGKEAGQEIFHTHLHIIPYYTKEMKKENNENILNKILNKK